MAREFHQGAAEHANVIHQDVAPAGFHRAVEHWTADKALRSIGGEQALGELGFYSSTYRASWMPIASTNRYAASSGVTLSRSVSLSAGVTCFITPLLSS